MKKLYYLIVLTVILGLVLTGCLLSNLGQVPTSEQSGISYLTKSPGPDLVGLWHFDEGSGTTANDSSGSLPPNDGTITGATYATSGNAMFGDALSFDVNDYVEVPGSTSMNVSSSYTFEAWINMSGEYEGYCGFFRRGDLSTPDSEIEIYTQPSTNENHSGELTVVHNRGGDFCYNYFEEFPVNQWVHLVVTWDGTSLRAYYDNLEQSVTLTKGDLVDPVASTPAEPNYIGVGFIGKGLNIACMNGLIDEVRIWSSALTADQLDDMIPPTLSKRLDGTLGLADWYTSDVIVTLTGDDPTPGSGLNRVEYSFDGTTWSIYGTPFTISAEGTTTLYHRAYDNAENVFVLPAQYIKIDKTLPVITLFVPLDGDTYILKQSVASDYSATDPTPGSGLVSCVGDVINGNNIDTETDGLKTFIVTATDVAGNVATVSVTYYVIENFVTGGGNIKGDKKVAWTFAGTVGVIDDAGIVGQFQIVDHTSKGAVSWHCDNDNFTYLEFTGEAAGSPEASHNKVIFTGSFTNDREALSKEITVTIQDLGEPGARTDKIEISGDIIVSQTTISGGNFQVHDIDFDIED